MGEVGSRTTQNFERMAAVEMLWQEVPTQEAPGGAQQEEPGAARRIQRMAAGEMLWQWCHCKRPQEGAQQEEPGVGEVGSRTMQNFRRMAAIEICGRWCHH